MSYSVYVLKSSEGHTYIGMTNNLERRLKEHNSGQSKFTSQGTDWKVIYQEQALSGSKARRREVYFKSHAGKEWLMRRDIL